MAGKENPATLANARDWAEDIEPWWNRGLEIYDVVEFKTSIKGQNQEAQGRGRAAIWDFSTDGHHRLTPPDEIPTPSALYDQLKKPTEVGSGPCRRLIILEDLGRTWIEMLGPRFNIPPHVFALHWYGPYDLFLGRIQVPLGQDPLLHFILSYTQVQNGIAVPAKGYLFRIDCNAKRPVPNPSHAATDQLISYWGSEVGPDGSWNALLLVDPPLRAYLKRRDTPLEPEEKRQPFPPNDPPPPTPSLTASMPPPPVAHPRRDDIVEVRAKDSGTAPETTPTGLEVGRDNKTEVRAGGLRTTQETTSTGQGVGRADATEMRAEGSETTPGTSIRSGSGNRIEAKWRTVPEIFGDLLSPDQGAPSAHPVSSTYRCRRVVLARTAASLHVNFHNTLHLTAEISSREDLREWKANDYANTEWLSDFRGTMFYKLWEQRENVELNRFKLRGNIKILRSLSFRDPDVRHFSETYRNKYRLAKRQEKLDLLEWEELDRRGDYMFQMMKRSVDSYMQTVGAGDAQVANNQAIAVRGLTALATFFIPFATVATIFAIPSDKGGNGPDSATFWLYWAVAAPFALAIGLLLLSPTGRLLYKVLSRGLLTPIATSWKEHVWDKIWPAMEHKLPDRLKYDEREYHRRRLDKQE